MNDNVEAIQEAINMLCGAGRPELAKAVSRVWNASQHDHLTGLLNRAAFDEKMACEIDRAARYGRPLSVITIDVDHFKAINDTFGHLAGDDVLKWVGNLLLKSSRSTDFAARTGGDEFVIIAPETACENAAVVAERFRDALRRSLVVTRGGPVRVSVTVGMAALKGHEAADDLLDRADKQMLAAKRARPEGIERRRTMPRREPRRALARKPPQSNLGVIR